MYCSVIICTHNRAAILEESLPAIADLRPPEGGNWEVVIVDNASTDHTAQVVRAFADRVAFPVKYIFEEQLGHSFALNRGVRESSGEVIAFTDDDARPVPRWLNEIECTLAEYNADWVVGKVVPVWPKGMPRWFSPVMNNQFALIDYGDKPFVIDSTKHSFAGVNHACRREAIDRLGGYREDMGLFGGKIGVGNDVDLFQRGLKAGYRFIYQPAALVYHAIEPARCEQSYWRRRFYKSGEDYHDFLMRNLPDATQFLGLPRYYYRLALGELTASIGSWLRRDRPKSFYHELRLRRYLGLFRQHFRRNRSSPGLTESPMTQPTASAANHAHHVPTSKPKLPQEPSAIARI